MASLDEDPDADSGRIRAEVEALTAIYGESAVTFDSSTGAVAVDLSPLVSFSCLLPSNYPSEARPRNPTVRSSGLSRKDAERIAEACVSRVHEDISIGTEVLFQYCQAVLDDVDDAGLVLGHGGQESDAEASASGSASTAVDPRHACFGDGSLIVHSEPLMNRKSVFQAHAARVDSVENARNFTSYLLAKFPKLSSASHHIMAYRIGPAQDFDDDGEHGAGKGLLFTLQQIEIDCVVVVVSRWFGGTKLGPLRFKLINNTARSLLTEQASKLV